MTVTIEVFGVVRALIGGPAARLESAEPITVRGALAAVGARHPALVGAVLGPDGCSPLDSVVMSLDGRRVLRDLDEVLPDGSHLLLMNAVAGGAPEVVSGRGLVVEIDDPGGAVTRWQRYGHDRLFLDGLKGVYIGLDDGHAPEFSNPAYPWGCEQITKGGGLGGYRYWYRRPDRADATVVVRFTGARPS